jgi:hypothetical protein
LSSASLRTSNSSDKAGKTVICRLNGKGELQSITVSDNAVSAHLRKGDFVSGSFTMPPGTTYSASAVWAGGGPAVGPVGNAFDGDVSTEWNAGAGPVQWIEIDFGSPQVIAGITGLVDQTPNGFTNHDVTLDGVAAFSWTGNTVTGQELSYTFAAPQTVQKVRITTTVSPSWAAWFEINVKGPGC